MRGGVRDAEICDDTRKCVMGAMIVEVRDVWRLAGPSRIRRKWEAVVFGGARLAVPWGLFAPWATRLMFGVKANRRFGLDCNGTIVSLLLC